MRLAGEGITSTQPQNVSFRIQTIGRFVNGGKLLRAFAEQNTVLRDFFIAPDGIAASVGNTLQR